MSSNKNKTITACLCALIAKVMSSTLFIIIHQNIHPLFCIFSRQVSKSFSITICVISDVVIHWDTRMVIEYIDKKGIML